MRETVCITSLHWWSVSLNSKITVRPLTLQCAIPMTVLTGNGPLEQQQSTRSYHHSRNLNSRRGSLLISFQFCHCQILYYYYWVFEWRHWRLPVDPASLINFCNALSFRCGLGCFDRMEFRRMILPGPQGRIACKVSVQYQSRYINIYLYIKRKEQQKQPNTHKVDRLHSFQTKQHWMTLIGQGLPKLHYLHGRHALSESKRRIWVIWKPWDRCQYRDDHT